MDLLGRVEAGLIKGIRGLGIYLAKDLIKQHYYVQSFHIFPNWPQKGATRKVKDSKPSSYLEMPLQEGRVPRIIASRTILDTSFDLWI